MVWCSLLKRVVLRLIVCVLVAVQVGVFFTIFWEVQFVLQHCLLCQLLPLAPVCLLCARLQNDMSVCTWSESTNVTLLFACVSQPCYAVFRMCLACYRVVWCSLIKSVVFRLIVCLLLYHKCSYRYMTALLAVSKR